MAAEPTIYRRPTTSLPPKDPSERTKRLWDRHRKKHNKSTKIPKSKIPKSKIS